MFSFFKSDPTKNINKLYEAKLEKAMQAQMNGDIKSYSQLTFEAEEIHKQIKEIGKTGSK